jgi:broad specificity phosphatase PhoE
MTQVAFIRHGKTDWNQDRRLQGLADIPLNDDGRSVLRACRVPTDLMEARWVASPLARAVETARILSGGDVAIEPRLIEMDWGEWEGHRLTDLRENNENEMKNLESAGLDLRPPGGESPRQVWERLTGWLTEIADAPGLVAAVTHKGVIRTAMAGATGWNMLGKPPVRLDWECAHLFSVAADGALTLVQPNLSLAGEVQS